MNRVENTEALIAASQQLRRQLAADHHRPAWHFMPPEAWMNDINGAIYWQGRYHIFYQYNPEGAYWKDIQWAHASSVDLVHWVDHPVALVPGPEAADRTACFSGGAFVTNEGVPAFIYHGIPGGTCLAFSRDELLLHWEKSPANPVIPVPAPGEAGHDRYTVYDPCLWVEDGVYYALIGNYVPGVRGDATSLFRSDDLTRWDYVGPFYLPRPEWTEPAEDCAVPDFYRFGDRYMLMFNSHLHGTQYYIGEFTGERFLPEIHGRLALPGGAFGGNRSLEDAQGRRIHFDWLRELRGLERERASGWSGVMTLPVELVPDRRDGVHFVPVPELEALRLGEQRFDGLTVAGETPLAGVRSRSLEIDLECGLDSGTVFSIDLLRAVDGGEFTRLTCDPEKGLLYFDLAQSTLDPAIRYYHYRNDQPDKLENYPITRQEAAFRLESGEKLHLRIFVDASVIEVFANRRRYLAQRVYPANASSDSVALAVSGSPLTVDKLRLWELAPAR